LEVQLERGGLAGIVATVGPDVCPVFCRKGCRSRMLWPFVAYRFYRHKRWWWRPRFAAVGERSRGSSLQGLLRRPRPRAGVSRQRPPDLDAPGAAAARGVVRDGRDRRTVRNALRHTFASALLTKTGDLRLVQAAMDHASIVSTTIHTQVDRARLRKAVGA